MDDCISDLLNALKDVDEKQGVILEQWLQYAMLSQILHVSL